MRIYNYLFFKTYLLAKRSKNFDDVPALGGMLFVMPCLMFNIFTVFILLEACSINTGIEFKKEYKIVFCFSLVAFLYLYYIYKGRYKGIIKKFEQQEEGIKIPSILVIIIYYVTSFVILLIAGMYKNHYWIFK